MNLGELQINFQQRLLDAECKAASWITGSPHGLPPAERLGIYHSAYRARLVDVLFDTFGHTAAYLGDEWFQRLAADYVQHNQSKHANIGQYGEAFPSHLAKELPDDGDVSELAEMDWTLRRAFDGCNAAVLTPAELQQLASQEGQAVQLQAVPTATVLTQRFNTLQIWRDIDNDTNPPQAEKLDEPVSVLVWRKEHAPHFRSLSAFETTAISIIGAGCGLEQLGAALVERFPNEDVATQFGELLHRWIDDEVLLSINASSVLTEN